MRHILSFLFFPIFGFAQVTFIRIGDPVNLVPPAISANGSAVCFAAATAPDGTPQKGTNLYAYGAGTPRQLTSFAGDSTYTGVTGTSISRDGTMAAFTALPAGPNNPEEVRLINMNTGTVRTLATDKQGCAQPLCANCFAACLRSVHLNADASKVLYAASRQQPFFAVNADGTGLTQLPIYSGVLAPPSQRVISSTGVAVFTSSAPSGPTFAAAATDIYVMNLDGTGLKQVTRFGDPMFRAADATISADGSLIAFEGNFSSLAQQQASQIWSVRTDGTGLQQLSQATDPATSPSISGDGSIVTFLQSGQIKRARTSGGQPVLTLTTLSISAPLNSTVSEDGSQVVFTLGPSNGSQAAVYRIPTNAATDVHAFQSLYAPRFLSPNGVGSATGYGSASPGSLISVYGANLSLDELTAAEKLPLPSTLNEISLLVNGSTVPLLATTPWQINAQLPQSVAAGTASFQVRYSNGATLPPVSAEVKNVSPVNFSFPIIRGLSYYQQAAAFHAGTAVAADLDHPAAAGETLEIYGTGLGMTTPSVGAGLPSPSSPLARVAQTPRVQIGGRDAVVTFAGLTPGLVGVYQVNAVVPSGLAAGLQTLGWVDSNGTGIYSSIAIAGR